MQWPNYVLSAMVTHRMSDVSVLDICVRATVFLKCGLFYLLDTCPPTAQTTARSLSVFGLTRGMSRQQTVAAARALQSTHHKPASVLILKALDPQFQDNLKFTVLHNEVQFFSIPATSDIPALLVAMAALHSLSENAPLSIRSAKAFALLDFFLFGVRPSDHSNQQLCITWEQLRTEIA